MSTIIGIAGSLRKKSYNAALLRAAARAAPAGVTLEIASLEGVPLYNGDLESESGIPDAVAQLKERIAAADGLVLATPEYNNSIPGVLKNAIDWLSRPPNDIARVFGNKPVGLMGATPGRAGTRMAQTAWLPVLRLLGTMPWFGKQLHVASAGQVFDESGDLVDDSVRELVADYMAGFASFIAANR